MTRFTTLGAKSVFFLIEFPHLPLDLMKSTDKVKFGDQNETLFIH